MAFPTRTHGPYMEAVVMIAKTLCAAEVEQVAVAEQLANFSPAKH